MAAMGRYVEHRPWSIEFQYTVNENLLHRALAFQRALANQLQTQTKEQLALINSGSYKDLISADTEDMLGP